uniref:Niban-like protein 1 n=1 Tax=Gouania willdenowi TaxID=441366 RepID=A0A8C5HCC2_GOUWI
YEKVVTRTTEVMGEFGRLYEQQYAVSLFNKVRFDIEGGGGPQPQLLHRKVPLEDKSIFSGSLFQYLEDNKKWRNRFLFIPDSYNINLYENKAAYDRCLHPKGTINCAGYKVLTSLDQYLELLSNSLPGVKAKVGSSPFLKCVTQFPLFLWHPYARHVYFCVATEKEQQKWHAVLQDCVRHSNDGLSEENKIQTPAFTDAVRLHRQAQGHYGTWEMMCGVPPQILSNLVMEGLHPELRDLISPRLKGKLHDRQRNWMLISDAVYSMVQGQCQAQYEAMLQRCEGARSSLEASIRTDMDQIITSKEHVTNKIRAVVLPKAEKLLKVSIQPYIGSILDALMEPTSRGFSEVRDVFFRELVDMSKNTLNEGTKETVAQHMEKISMLAYHPVKMQSCYEKVEQLSLEGLQQRFDVSSPSVFVQRAQILMREQMDDAVYTFEQILHQSLEAQGSEDICKTIQRCQDRVIKKFDYDSSTVRKRFFREALLQIFIPYMLKQLSPSCVSELPRFQELIFEDFSRFILVENIFEEVVLHSVMKDIMMAVKEAAVQRRHNLYRDSIVLSNSDPSLHLLGENPSIDWAGQYGGAPEETDGAAEEAEGDGVGGESHKKRRMKQVVSMIQVEGSNSVLGESCLEVPGVDDIPEETVGEEDEADDETPSGMSNGSVMTHAKTEEVSLEVEVAAKEKNDVVLKQQEAVALEMSTKDNSVNVVQEEAAASLKDQTSAPLDDQGSVPVEDQTSGAVKDQASAPVEDQASATMEVPASAQVEDQASAPVEDQASAPVEDQASAPVEDQASAPVEDQASVTVEVQPSAQVEVQGSAPVEDQDNKGVDCKVSEVLVLDPVVVEEQPPTSKTESEEVMPPPSPAESIPSDTVMPAESPPEKMSTITPPPHDDSGFQSPASDVVEMPTNEESVVT